MMVSLVLGLFAALMNMLAFEAFEDRLSRGIALFGILCGLAGAVLAAVSLAGAS